MPSIKTSIEIAASPSTVRAIFLEFPKYSDWHHGFFKSITPDTTSPEAKDSKTGTSLRPGDTLHVIIGLDNMTLHPTILSNSTKEFSWGGKLWGIPGLFTGVHSFKFEESNHAENPGGTTFSHGEVFSGILSLLIREGSAMHSKTKGGFEGFNRDLKAKCEQK
jgi:hypothetical protein